MGGKSRSPGERKFIREKKGNKQRGPQLEYCANPNGAKKGSKQRGEGREEGCRKRKVRKRQEQGWIVLGHKGGEKWLA